MTYTNTWNESIPVGGDPANTADDLFRQSKVDVRERLNTLMGYAIGTALTDPLIPSGKGLMASRNKSLWVPVWAMAWISQAGTLSAPQSTGTDTPGLNVVQGTHTQAYFHCPLYFPVGSYLVIAGGATPPEGNYISFLPSGGTTTYTIKLYKRAYGATVGTEIGSGSGSGAFTGIQNLGFGVSSPIVAEADTEYHVTINIQPGAGQTVTFYGLKYTYRSDDYTLVL